MSDLTVTATMTRALVPGGPLADLALEDAGKYRLIRNTLGPGPRSYRRSTVDNGYAEGRFLVAAVLDVAMGAVGVRVIGLSASQLDTRVAALLAAFSQLTYSMTFTIDGVVHTWANCEPADAQLGSGGVIVDHQQRALVQEWRLIVPHDPTPTTGAW